MDSLRKERIRYVGMNDALIRLSMAIDLTKDCGRLWKNTRNAGRLFKVERKQAAGRTLERNPPRVVRV